MAGVAGGIEACGESRAFDDERHGFVAERRAGDAPPADAAKYWPGRDFRAVEPRAQRSDRAGGLGSAERNAELAAPGLRVGFAPPDPDRYAIGSELEVAARSRYGNGVRRKGSSYSGIATGRGIAAVEGRRALSPPQSQPTAMRRVSGWTPLPQRSA